jgi:hypothetical protein
MSGEGSTVSFSAWAPSEDGHEAVEAGTPDLVGAVEAGGLVDAVLHDGLWSGLLAIDADDEDTVRQALGGEPPGGRVNA